MTTDDVVAGVRAAREAYAARFGFDLDAIARDLQQKERAGGWVVVPPPAAAQRGTTRPAGEPVDSNPSRT